MFRRSTSAAFALIAGLGLAVGAAAPVGAQTTTAKGPTTTAKSSSGSGTSGSSSASGTSGSSGSATKPTGTEPMAWILIDADRGVVYGGRNLHTAYPVANAATLMTALTAAQQLPFASNVKVSELAAKQPARKLGLNTGATLTFGDALRAMLIGNANDAAYAIAETAGGDLAGFAKQMNVAAQSMGMKDSTFNDPAGLDGSTAFNGGTSMSPYDLAIAARNLHGARELADITKQRTADINASSGSYSVQNVNLSFLDAYKAGDGLKAGYSDKAGRTLVASATKNGRTMIAVVLNSGDPVSWAIKSLDRGFASDDTTATIDEPLPQPVSATAEAVARSLGAIPPVLGRPALAAAAGVAQPISTATSAATTTARPAGSDAKSTDSGLGGFGYFLVFVLLLLAAVVALRVRAVKRRRQRRAQRLRAFNDAQRRGAITVLDADQYTQPNHVKTVASRR